MPDIDYKPRDIGLKYPASFADPPITPDECDEAALAVCRQHNGRIREQRAVGDYDGKVFFCPIGKSWWRLTRKMSGMSAPLAWPKGM